MDPTEEMRPHLEVKNARGDAVRETQGADGIWKWKSWLGTIQIFRQETLVYTYTVTISKQVYMPCFMHHANILSDIHLKLIDCGKFPSKKTLLQTYYLYNSWVCLKHPRKNELVSILEITDFHHIFLVTTAYTCLKTTETMWWALFWDRNFHHCMRFFRHRSPIFFQIVRWHLPEKGRLFFRDFQDVCFWTSSSLVK